MENQNKHYPGKPGDRQQDKLKREESDSTDGVRSQGGEIHNQEEENPDREHKIDDQLDQSFPASDPPSYSQPGNELDEDEGEG